MNELNQAPFAWQDKRILRRIREQIEDYGSALAVYHALTVVASDMQKEEFQTTQSWLAQMSGFTERTVRSRLHDLQTIKAVEIITPKLRAPSTYRLLPFGNGCRASGNGCRAFGNENVKPLPTSEVSKFKKKKVAPLPVVSVEIPESLKGEDFEQAWQDWCADRLERKKRITARAAKLQLEELAGMGKAKAIASIKASIKGGWQGLFEPKAEIKADSSTTLVTMTDKQILAEAMR